MSVIRNAVLSGEIATVHEMQINFHGWVGSGYLLIDPEIGAGAYNIAGGGWGFSNYIGACNDRYSCSCCIFRIWNCVSPIYYIIGISIYFCRFGENCIWIGSANVTGGCLRL